MFVPSDLFDPLFCGASDEAVRARIRDELRGAGAWEWPLLHQLILSQPNSDGPRLLAADWLSDEGDDRLADFIRVQCRASCLVDVYGADALMDPRGVTVVSEMERLAGELGERLTAEFGIRGETDVESSGNGVVTARTGAVALVYARGFIDRVETPTPEFLTLAADLFRAHPINSVVLTDKRPIRVAGGYWWADDCLDPTEPECLARHVPPELYLYLTVSFTPSGQPRHGVNPADLTFASAASARAALSAACVAFGRATAGR